MLVREYRLAAPSIIFSRGCRGTQSSCRGLGCPQFTSLLLPRRRRRHALSTELLPAMRATEGPESQRDSGSHTFTRGCQSLGDHTECNKQQYQQTSTYNRKPQPPSSQNKQSPYPLLSPSWTK